MVCPNCSSSDIVTIQGQNYCINCGQLVPDQPKSQAPVPKVVATAVAKPKPKPDPLPQSVILNHTKPKVTAVPPAPASAPKTITPPSRPRASGKQINDLSPAKRPVVNPVPQAEPENFLAAELPTIVKEEKKRARRAEKKAQQKAIKQAKKTHVVAKKASKKAEGSSVLTGLAAIFDRRYWNFGLSAAILSVLPASAVSFFIMNQALQVWGRVVSDDSLRIGLRDLSLIDLRLTLDLGQNLTLLSAVVLAYLALAHVIQVYAGNAIIYGASKVADHRSVAPATWAGVGLNSLWGVIFVDVLSMGMLFVLVCINALVPQSEAKLVSGVALAISALLAAGIIIVRKLSRSAIVLGNLTPLSAYGLGWRLLVARLWRALGALLVSLIFSGLLVLGYLAAAGSLLINFRPSLDSSLGLAATGIYVLLGIVVVAVCIIFNLVYWTGVYRSLVRRTYPNVAALMVARQPQPVAARVLWALGLLTAVVLTLGLIVSLQS